MSRTEENSKTAFVGEAKAVVRLQGFADQAEKEGYNQIAKLFRAISAAEMVHAKKHLRNLRIIKSTEENLKYAFESETAVGEERYPEFIRQAAEDGDKPAEIAFTQARDVEEFHAKLYKRALEFTMEEKETNYRVCTICGYVTDGEAPDNCPVCNAPKDKFIEVS
jgi:rubrerythrin